VNGGRGNWRLANLPSHSFFRYPYTRPAHGEFVIICDLSVFGTGGGLCKVSENRLFLGNWLRLISGERIMTGRHCTVLLSNVVRYRVVSVKTALW